MVRLFRMYRFCVLVKKQIDAQNAASDGHIRDFMLEAGDNPRFLDKNQILHKFQPKFTTKNKYLLAEEICESCLANNYLLSDPHDPDKVTLNQKHGGGADLAHWAGVGYVKELLRINNHFLTLLISLAALTISILAYLKSS